MPKTAGSSGSSARDAPRQCGRQGCGKVENDVDEFSLCSRCKTTAYCSAECQKLDLYSGHGRCTLKALVDAPESGTWTDSCLKQAAQLLTSNTRTPLLRPTLDAIQAALCKKAASIPDPATCPQLINQHPQLLAALTRAYDVHTFQDKAALGPMDLLTTPSEYHDINRVAAAVLHLSAPTICRILLDTRSSQDAVQALYTINQAFGGTRNCFKWFQGGLNGPVKRASMATLRTFNVRGFVHASLRGLPKSVDELPLGFLSLLVSCWFSMLASLATEASAFGVPPEGTRGCHQVQEMMVGIVDAMPEGGMS